MFSGCTLLINSLLPNEYEVLESNWNIYLPKANEVKDILTTEANFHGDGEWFALFGYSKPIGLSNTSYIKLTSNEISDANNRIAQFKKEQLIFVKIPKKLLSKCVRKSNVHTKKNSLNKLLEHIKKEAFF
ncbi:hypothetical protein ABH968_001275 [Lysinibacillus sp. RC79]